MTGHPDWQAYPQWEDELAVSRTGVAVPAAVSLVSEFLVSNWAGLQLHAIAGAQDMYVRAEWFNSDGTIQLAQRDFHLLATRSLYVGLPNWGPRCRIAWAAAAAGSVGSIYVLPSNRYDRVALLDSDDALYQAYNVIVAGGGRSSPVFGFGFGPVSLYWEANTQSFECNISAITYAGVVQSRVYRRILAAGADELVHFNLGPFIHRAEIDNLGAANGSYAMSVVLEDH